MGKISNIIGKNGFFYICYYFLRLTKLDRLCSDEFYIRLKYKCYTGSKLNLNPPITYNEKLQWLKLHDHNPLYPTLVDKYAVKEYVKKIIGEKYIIKTLGIWDNPNNIDWDILPNQFVLKCTHDSGGLVICKNKEQLNKATAIKKLKKALKINPYYAGREWPYKNVKPRIIAEEYMEDIETRELRDYKFFCFDGKVKALFVGTDRQKIGEDVKFDFFDTNYNHLDIRQGHPNAKIPPAKPQLFDEMLLIASQLSKGFPELRVDLYECNKKVYFGELTFYHHNGTVPFDPISWDKIFGDWIDLSTFIPTK